MAAEQNPTLIDSLSSFFNGTSTLKVNVGIDPENMIKLAIVAIITTLVCVVIAKTLK